MLNSSHSDCEPNKREALHCHTKIDISARWYPHSRIFVSTKTLTKTRTTLTTSGFTVQLPKHNYYIAEKEQPLRNQTNQTTLILSLKITKNYNQYTFGRYTDNRAWASEPGTRAKSRKAESTDAVNLRLSEIVRRTARPIRRTSLVYEPVSISDAISFKSIKTPQIRTHTRTKLYENLIIKNETLELEIDEIEIEDRKSSSSSSRSYSEKWMGRRW